MFKSMMLSTILLLAMLSPAWSASNPHALDEPTTISKIFENVKWNQGVAYSLVDNKLNYLSTFDLANFKGFTLAGGYAGDSESTQHKVVATLSYNLVNAKKLGIEIPVLDLVDVSVGGYFGAGRLNFKEMGESETDYGLTATILKLKW